MTALGRATPPFPPSSDLKLTYDLSNTKVKDIISRFGSLKRAMIIDLLEDPKLGKDSHEEELNFILEAPEEGVLIFRTLRISDSNVREVLNRVLSMIFHSQLPPQVLKRELIAQEGVLEEEGGGDKHIDHFYKYKWWYIGGGISIVAFIVSRS